MTWTLLLYRWRAKFLMYRKSIGKKKGRGQRNSNPPLREHAPGPYDIFLNFQRRRLFTVFHIARAVKIDICKHIIIICGLVRRVSLLAELKNTCQRTHSIRLKRVQFVTLPSFHLAETLFNGISPVAPSLFQHTSSAQSIVHSIFYHLSTGQL